MSFEALRSELETLAKAQPQDATGALEVAAAGAPAEGETESEGGELMGKSFSFQLADGTTVDAVDGTDLVKSFGERLVGTEQGLAKALADVTEVIGMQTGLIKSLQAQVVALGGAGAGRRSVLSVRETVSPANTEQVLAKSHGFSTGKEAMDAAWAAHQANRITSTELSKCENYVGRGLQFPADLAAKVSA